MVERRLLTAEFVDAVEAPQSGERWIADTQLRGFGLRLWANGQGGAAAFAIRTTNFNGESVRRTFDPYSAGFTSWRFRVYVSRESIDFSAGIPLSFFLTDARRWAKKALGQAKGRMPTDEELSATRTELSENRNRVKAYLDRMPFGRAAEVVISYGPYRGWSLPYADRMNKLFFLHVPSDVQKTSVGDITRDDIERILSAETLTTANAQALQSLLHQVLRRVDEMGGPAMWRHMPQKDPPLWDRPLTKDDIFVDGLSHSDFEPLFEALEVETSRWPQLLCLRLAFPLRSPISRLMRARWDQIVEVRWYPFAPGERKYWYAMFSNINEHTYQILERIFHLGQKNFGRAPYWFPSNSSACQHITNTDRAWRSVINKIGWPSVPLRQVTSHYQRLTVFDELERFSHESGRRAAISAQLSKFSRA